MPLAHFVTDSEKKWLFKVTEKQSKWPERDLCLLTMFLATPCSILQLNQLRVGDVISGRKKLVRSFPLAGVRDSRGDEIKVYLTNPTLKKRLLDYLTEPDYVLHNLSLFKTMDGSPFSLTKTKTGYKADSLKRHIFNLLQEAGIEKPGVDCGRRTFAVNLQRKGFDFAHIHHLLGNKTEKATRRLLVSDPVDMGAIAKEAF